MNDFQQPPRRRVLLIIMDGIGVNPCKLNNAVALADTQNLDRIYSTHPTCLLEASGRAVGLPEGQMGNSEVGHLSIGAGTVLRQDLVKIGDAIADGTFAENEAVCGALERAKSKGVPLHLLGLVSDGGVHSHTEHLIALIELCAKNQVTPVLHVISDGRDTAPSSVRQFMGGVLQSLEKADGHIATVSGRYFAMDRDTRWDRVESAWQAIACAQGRKAASVDDAIQKAYDAGETDEFITPTVLDTHKPLDAQSEVFFFNFRNDRPRELSEALGLAEFEGFDRGDFTPVTLTTMTRYESSYPFACAFTRDEPGKTLGQAVSDAGIKQIRSAETEKYPHVTFFFNGGQDAPLAGEERLLVASPKVATYDLKPEMSAVEVTDGIVRALEEQSAGLIVVNLANGDMVGHTGVREAVVSAVETVDKMVGRMWECAVANDYSIVLAADHGNADMLLDPVSGDPHTQHTTFPVACVVHDTIMWELGNGNGLPSIAPTILQLMGLDQPESMTGSSLLLGPY
ncbi:2,3-bisphosphoglycerate-independent phosphoglycerate mutase [Granulosicoccus antarcticus]|uniref:2,3-bisphosphoglycerate-independent phosphoglycerate mutase n=1 Tax=Granulosicoccus antarcticus IMCC3135 TaxID=1192854 RepID=A0A2Z2P2D7_9GAMM|nr:2,3-bisphosphoglycerate-independent phosphoglycerate mutase [Granulosicoccus antarcticus]ASJ76468.1 2,3-bisphosphoglycerate-independent phosphoglycerate mutase [Granulosicoccus antarcticus IMCC3135]